jgi:hypothetical protein
VETGLPYNVCGGPPTYTQFADEPERLIKTRRYGLAAAAKLFAGPIAEARYRRGSLLGAMLSGGHGD